MDPEKTYNVLFLCTGNSARSILGEAIINRLGAGRIKAQSAGSFPRGGVHPYTIDLLKQFNYKTEGLRSKSWDEFGDKTATHFDFIFTVCDEAAEETCPIWPGHPMMADWGIPDPAKVEGTEAEKRAAFADAYGILHNRIAIFVSLPLASLDRLALKNSLDQIGQAKN